MKKSLFFYLILFVFLTSSQVFGQTDNYQSINIQGQFINGAGSESNFEFLVLNSDNDTLYRESHDGVLLTNEGSFTLDFGHGTFIAGSVENLFELDWLTVEKIQLYRIADVRYLQGSFGVQTVPYALHSYKVNTIPKLIELIDVDGGGLSEGKLIKFNGITYSFEIDEVADTANFVWMADSVFFADTVWFAYNHEFSDSTLYGYFADSGNFALEIITVGYTDTAQFVDSVNFATYSIGNWSISGDSLLGLDNFVGSRSSEDFVLRTNSNSRLILGENFDVNNNSPGIGFRLNAPTRGVLFTPNADPGLTEIEDAFLYFDGETSSFHAGTIIGEFDSLKGLYSFAFGENVGTNGTYSTIFGYNSFGDTAYFGGITPYPAISSFAMGRNCRVAHMSVAIGDSAIADYYRNVAVGHKVVATSQSAGLAMGSNVYTSGATSWAVGHNLTATGNFATVMGTNASTGTRKGGFIFGDLSTTDTVISSLDNQFIVRADGGVIFYSSGDLSMGVELLPGAGSWSMVSDHNKKFNINQLNPLSYSNQFDSLSVFQWNYIGQSTLHIGPMAQDFYHLFQVGEKNYYINMIDADGVIYLGIKRLVEELKDVPTEENIIELEEKIINEQEELDELELRINELYEKVDHN